MKKAFTLLEILVVMGIIAVLLGLGAVSYSTAQKKARDARRNGDLEAAQHVMEQCMSASTSYQYPTISDPSNNGTLTASCTVNGTTTSFSITDPVNVAPNVYTFTNSSPVGTTYSLTASLEISGATVTLNNQQ